MRRSRTPEPSTGADPARFVIAVLPDTPPETGGVSPDFGFGDLISGRLPLPLWYPTPPYSTVYDGCSRCFERGWAGVLNERAGLLASLQTITRHTFADTADGCKVRILQFLTDFTAILDYDRV